ncbi:TRAP transporter substrate-binding protein [Faecalibacterium prausnitzii]|uniref:TRAP transporter substrate-binding protein n=1 Tax=Faecalibacterium prausnitzii TaxID=853 RepID=UPI00266512F8|nr:TRAP transporter substrate-binding protein [Faecalibacterium prausnitzii]
MERRAFLALCLAGLLAGCGAEKTEPVTPEFVLTYADNQPAGYPTTQGAERFAQLVQERTGGRVVIQVHSDAEYGTEQEIWEQLALGGVDFARLSLAIAADDLPKLNVLQLPYLYRDAAHMWRVLDGALGEDFLQEFTRRELVGLSWYDAGARSFYAKQPIRSLNDLAGTTVRVQDSQIVLDMMRLLGSQPVTFAYSDVYSAFQTGKIDAAENNWPAYYRMDHYKVAPYYTVDEHSRVPEVQLASGRTWAQLPEEYQTILRQCARESAQYERQLWTEEEARARQSVLATGCREITLSEEELEAFRTLVQPLYARYCGEELELVEAIQQA